MNINNDPRVNRIKSFTTIDAIGIVVGILLLIVSGIFVISTGKEIEPTLQMFILMLVMLVLAGRDGTFSVGLYVLMGALGFSVFPGHEGGVSALFGLRGGYIIGMILLALMMWRITTFLDDKTWVKIFAIIMGLVVYYVCGTIWFAALSSMGFIPAFLEVTLPLVPYDIVMSALAFGLSIPLNKIIKLDRHRLT